MLQLHPARSERRVDDKRVTDVWNAGTNTNAGPNADANSNADADSDANANAGVDNRRVFRSAAGVRNRLRAVPRRLAGGGALFDDQLQWCDGGGQTRQRVECSGDRDA